MPPPVYGSPSGIRPHRGAMILVFGILGFFCFIFGIVAWVMGNADMSEIRAGRMDPSGEGLTNAGRILGIIVTLLNIAMIVLYFLIIVLAIGAGVASGGGSP